MQIVRDKDTLAVLYFAEDGEFLELGEYGLYGAMRALDVRPDTHEIMRDVPETTFLQLPRLLSYGPDGWRVVDPEVYATMVTEIIQSQDHPLVVKAKVAAAREFEREVSLITKGYSESEVKSWDQQLLEAQAFTAHPEAPTPLLDALAASREIGKAELVNRVLVNAAGFAVAVGSALGRKQKRIDQLTVQG